MITFTLRLQELEADALERLAFVYGVSKNRLLNALIANEYENFVGLRETTPPDKELIYISVDEDFPGDITEVMDGKKEYSKSDIKRVLKCYDFAIEHTENKEVIESLETDRREWVEEYADR